MKFSRSAPYFNALVKASPSRRVSILQSFPSFVVDDLIEILYNITIGSMDIGRKSQKLKKYQKSLVGLVNTGSKKTRRTFLYKQNGGFLGALIPIALSAIGAISGLVRGSKST